MIAEEGAAVSALAALAAARAAVGNRTWPVIMDRSRNIQAAVAVVTEAAGPSRGRRKMQMRDAMAMTMVPMTMIAMAITPDEPGSERG